MSMKAFTLIETMVAITILTLSVAGPLYTAGRATVAAATSRDQLTASYLSQEAVEYFRFLRDNEFLKAYQAGGTTISATAWSYFLTDPLSDTFTISGCIATTCTLDTHPTVPVGTGSGFSLVPCSGGSCAPLYLVNGLYTEKSNIGGTKTAFTRTVQATFISANDERVTATTTWSFHGIPYSVTVTNHLTPWQ